jgi:hypothetical protein
LYEAIAYFVFFWITLWLYRQWKERIGTGFFFGWCLTSIFTFRFFVEMFKEVQEPWELTMQQAMLLSARFFDSTPLKATPLNAAVVHAIVSNMADLRSYTPAFHRWTFFTSVGTDFSLVFSTP